MSTGFLTELATEPTYITELRRHLSQIFLWHLLSVNQFCTKNILWHRLSVNRIYIKLSPLSSWSQESNWVRYLADLCRQDIYSQISGHIFVLVVTSIHHHYSSFHGHVTTKPPQITSRHMSRHTRHNASSFRWSNYARTNSAQLYARISRHCSRNSTGWMENIEQTSIAVPCCLH